MNALTIRLRSAMRAPFAEGGVAAPMRHDVFRNIWFASLLSNFGLLIQAVGAAWAMTQLTSRADWVALVQTALMLPVMLVSLPAGALADMFDRRVVGLWALASACAGAAALCALSYMGLVTPVILLVFCFAIGTGMALFSPAWQASVSEQVPAEILPSAVALNSISYNIARSFGPAIGGVIVALAGSSAAFLANALLYVPLLVTLHRWRRELEPARLPPERLARAIVSGVRYVVHSPPIRVILARSLVTGLAGGAISALMPLLARDLLGGGATTYGVMLGAFGVGAVAGALNIAVVRRLDGEFASRICLGAMGLATVVAALSHIAVVTAIALTIAGAAWMVGVALFNIALQLSAPRWVAGRALASFQTAIAGGIAVGSWGWGWLAQHQGVQTALLCSAGALILSPLLGLWLRLPEVSEGVGDSPDDLTEPEVAMAITGRSGPIAIEVEYQVDLEEARDFHRLMQDVQLARQRNGAYGWSIARDIADPERWIETWRCPTWHDYLRQRSRATEAERALIKRAADFHRGVEPARIRRMLERPFGSVRWNKEARDPGEALQTQYGPGA